MINTNMMLEFVQSFQPQPRASPLTPPLLSREDVLGVWSCVQQNEQKYMLPPPLRLEWPPDPSEWEVHVPNATLTQALQFQFQHRELHVQDVDTWDGSLCEAGLGLIDAVQVMPYEHGHDTYPSYGHVYAWWDVSRHRAFWVWTPPHVTCSLVTTGLSFWPRVRQLNERAWQRFHHARLFKIPPNLYQEQAEPWHREWRDQFGHAGRRAFTFTMKDDEPAYDPTDWQVPAMGHTLSPPNSPTPEYDPTDAYVPTSEYTPTGHALSPPNSPTPEYDPTDAYVPTSQYVPTGHALSPLNSPTSEYNPSNAHVPL